MDDLSPHQSRADRARRQHQRRTGPALLTACIGAAVVEAAEWDTAVRHLTALEAQAIRVSKLVRLPRFISKAAAMEWYAERGFDPPLPERVTRWYRWEGGRIT